MVGGVYTVPEMTCRKGMLPQTDEILARAINISIGVSDPGLGAGFGVSMHDGFEEVDRRAEKFQRVVKQYL